MTGPSPLLVGCGILRREIESLIRQNGWPLRTIFLDSALHADFDGLARELSRLLARHREEPVIVFYGTCHPLLDRLLGEAGALRTGGQNCIEMLLGKELFASELSAGAYFLLEEWARNWERIVTATFNTANVAVIRDIFQGDRAYLLGVRTPCSEDFTAEAEAAGRMVGLPLRWVDVGLEHLESVLAEAMERKREVVACPR